MQPRIQFLENEFKLALTEKPPKPRYSTGQAYPLLMRELEEWLESLIEISNPELLPGPIIKEGDSFELPSNLEFEQRCDDSYAPCNNYCEACGAFPIILLKLKTEVEKGAGDCYPAIELREQPDKLYTKQEVIEESQENTDLKGCVQLLNEMFKWAKVKNGEVTFQTSEKTWNTYKKFVREITI